VQRLHLFLRRAAGVLQRRRVVRVDIRAELRRVHSIVVRVGLRILHWLHKLHWLRIFHWLHRVFPRVVDDVEGRGLRDAALLRRRKEDQNKR